MLGPAELQPLERSQYGILVTDNVLWQLKVWVHILIMGIYHIGSSLVGRHCNTDSILAISVYNG